MTFRLRLEVPCGEEGLQSLQGIVLLGTEENTAGLEMWVRAA